MPFKPGVHERLRFSRGDRIQASVKLQGSSGFRNFGAFSYDRYLKGLGVHARAYSKSPLLVRETGPPPFLRPAVLFSRLRGRFERELETRFPSADRTDISPTGAILEAILLGDDGRMAPEHVAMLQKSGLYHLFAISGGHIAVIALLIYALLKLFGAGPRRRLLGLGVLLVFYSMLVEAGPTVMRAVIMAETMIAGKLLFRDVDLVNSISLSAFFLLLANPFSLFDAGFGLTYAATLGIILFAPPVQRALPKLPLGITPLAAMSAAASLSVLPIIARSFNRVALASLVLNFAAVPLTSLIMGLGYVFLGLALIPGPAAGVLARMIEVLCSIFVRIGGLLGPFPFFSFRVPTPRAWVFWGYYLFLGLILVRPRFRGQRAAAVGFFAACLVLITTSPFSPSSNDLKVTMIDVGQGDSFLVEFPGRERMLIDGGGIAGSSFDVGEKIVSPFIWSKGIKSLDAVVSTHSHPDHAGGLAAVLGNFPTTEYWEADGGPRRRAAYPPIEKSLGPGTSRIRVLAGYERTFGGVRVSVLHPEGQPRPGDPNGPNERSLVMRLSIGRRSFLFTGDIGRTTEETLLGSGRELKSSVLKTAHHGSAASTSSIFLAAVSPEAALIPVGPGNPYGFPSPLVLERLARAGAAVFRTDKEGSVEVRTDGRTILFRTALLGLLIDIND